MQTFFDLENKRLGYTNERKLKKQTKESVHAISATAEQTNSGPGSAQTQRDGSTDVFKNSADIFQEQFTKLDQVASLLNLLYQSV
jgi:hypothetical protein